MVKGFDAVSGQILGFPVTLLCYFLLGYHVVE